MQQLYRQIAVGGIALSAALLGAGGAGAFQTAASTATSNQTAETLVATMPTDDRSFIDLAASGDLYELAASRIAKERGVGGEVATFADRMIADHSATSAELKAVAASIGMSVPTELNGKHRSMLQALNEAGPGNPSTRAYVDGQRAAHNEAVALFTAYAQGGETPALKAFAQKHLPALTAHLDHIRRIEAMR
jgi:putative membrane protein